MTNEIARQLLNNYLEAEGEENFTIHEKVACVVDTSNPVFAVIFLDDDPPTTQEYQVSEKWGVQPLPT